MLLIKNDGHIEFIQDKKKLGWLSSFIISLWCLKAAYVVKSPVLGLQLAPENSELAPSV